MIQMVAVDAFDAEILFRYLEDHGLLSGAFRRNPGLIAHLQLASSYCIWNDGDSALALMLEIPLPEPHTMDIMIIPEDKALGKKKEDLIEFSYRLRERWFSAMGMTRIQAKVPASRVNMQRIMRNMGFRLETPAGLRDAIQLGENPPEGLLIYGLIPSDPMKVFVPAETEVSA